MYSFYGGRPGNSFVIVTTYRSVDEMKEKFGLGPAYTAVHFDQYVMINTPNKNDPDNGKIFRRGYNFNDQDTHGAQYIGCVAGPSGNAPVVHLTTMTEAQSKYNEEDPTGQWEKRATSGSYNINNSLVPGKTSDNTFNDSINWYCCSVISSDGETSQAYIGFNFPYLVIDINSDPVEPYDELGNYHDNAEVIKENNEGHPFYEKFNIKIPKGIKGDSIKNLKVEIASNEIQDYIGQEEDVENQKPVLVYEYYDYSEKQDGRPNGYDHPKKIYLGDYNMINNISIENDKDVVIEYTHNNSQTFQNVFKTITSTTLDENGNFEILYNFGQTYETQLNWVKDISALNDGTITIDYTQDQSKVYPNLLKWVNSITLAADGTLKIIYNDSQKTLSNQIKWIDSITTTEAGNLQINFNYGNPVIIPFKSITSMSVNEESGSFVIQYTDGQISQFNMKWVSNINLAENGILSVNYYNSNSNEYIGNIPWITNIYTDSDGVVKVAWNNRNEQQELTSFRWIEDIGIDTGNSEGEGTQRLKITWNDNNSEPTLIGTPINYIMETAINDNHHFLVRYSDPQRRNLGGVTWNGKNGWTDLGTVLINSVTDGDVYQNLRWNGIGQIVTSGIAGAKKYLHFVVVPIIPIDDAITTINMSGNLHAVITGETNPLNMNINSTNTVITKTLTGIQFSVDTGLTADGTAAPNQYADIIITDLYFEFLE